jgi:hypothetical protein
MYGLNLPAVHLRQFSKYCEKTGEIFHPAGGIFEILSSKDLFRSQEWQSKVRTLKGLRISSAVPDCRPPSPLSSGFQRSMAVFILLSIALSFVVSIS